MCEPAVSSSQKLTKKTSDLTYHGSDTFDKISCLLF